MSNVSRSLLWIWTGVLNNQTMVSGICGASLASVDATFRVLHKGSRCVSFGVVCVRAPAPARSSPQILPAAKKSIKKCVVSLRCAVGMGLSEMSGKAAEHEIEFRTVRRARGRRGERVFCLFIHMAPAFGGASARTGELNTPESAGGSLTSLEEVRSAGYSSGGKWGIKVKLRGDSLNQDNFPRRGRSKRGPLCRSPLPHKTKCSLFPRITCW